MTPRNPSRRIRLLKLWKRLWGERPGEMEKARLKATEAALNTYRTRNTQLAAYVQEWPATLTNRDLKERCQVRAVEYGFQPRSLKTKLKRLGLIAHDPTRRVWVNRCKLTACEPPPPRSNGGA